jgi:pimeloyl-ACP methyl ester carboxylesterase
LLAVVWLALLGGCAKQPSPGITAIKVSSLSELRVYLLNHKADLEQFRLQGPFAVAVQKDHEVRLSASERINSDLFLAPPGEKAPLVIILHGYDSSKEAHSHQCMHLASWGMHCLTIQLPRNGPWTGNGKTLARIVDLIYRRPETIDSRIDAGKIILAGHSFGASAVAIALAAGARAAGAILLDPAAVGRDLPGSLQKISTPVMVLGADEEMTSTRNRAYFFRFIRSGVAEISIRNASHEDAQYPSEYTLQAFGIDPYTTEELQITFASALTAAAFSLSSTGKFDYAWQSFGDALESGRLFNARKK